MGGGCYNNIMAKLRLDVALVERGLVESRALAQRMIMAGQVRVDGQVALKAATTIPVDATLVVDQGPPYVSRGGEKLAAAIQAWSEAAPTTGINFIRIQDAICVDVGASTGGFTDCLLQHGAAKVYAIDVGQGILHWKLRQDQRVVVMEKTNARFVTQLPEPVSLATIDASFISLKILLPVVHTWLTDPGNIVALIKPQFEAGRAQVARGDGVVRDPAIHRQVLQDVLGYAVHNQYSVQGLIASPLLGPKGNREFLVWLCYPGNDIGNPGYLSNLDELIDHALVLPASDASITPEA
jgi:23S rRNA (cytidine1920-2'-O)/16S rRNA (cytidine1409-2'-O)-methyltransferase